MSYRTRLVTAMSFSLLAFFAGCTSVPSTVENDPSLEFVELGNHRFHVRTFGDKQLPPVVGYLGKHPDSVSHAVVVEPGILSPASAVAFVRRFKASQSIWDAMPLVKYILLTPLVANRDGHERFDYVMTRLMNRAKPGGPYQCEGEAMPPDAFARAGYAAFDNMLKPVLDHPESFSQHLTDGVAAYKGKLLMLSSECSFIGYKYQQEFHVPSMPTQTVHVQAMAMGHNMLTLNSAWSVAVIGEFFSGVGPTQR